MKQLTTLIVCAALAAGVAAQDSCVTEAESRRIAARFLEARRRSPARHAGAPRAPLPVLAAHEITQTRTVRDTDGTLLAYVHDLAPTGFVIAAADARLRPIFGFSMAGRLEIDPRSRNPLLALVRRDVRSRLRALASSEVQAARRGSRGRGGSGSGPAGTVWGPWLTTEWHQRTPYNDLIPYLDPSRPNGGRRVTGCVATALAQVWNKHKHPASLAFSHDADHFVSDGGDHRIDFDNDAIAFGFPTFPQLTGRLLAISYDQRNGEVASMNLAAGIMVRMLYGTRESGAYVLDVEKAFQGKLGYGSAEYTALDVKSKKSGDWPDLREKLIANAKAGRPVVAGIYEVGKRGGHAVVIDGYRDDTELFHVNFGWGPKWNTWYDLPALDDYDAIDEIVADIAVNAGWPQFGADAQNTHRAPYPAPTDTDLKIKWRVTAGARMGFEQVAVGPGGTIYSAIEPLDSGKKSRLLVTSPLGVPGPSVPVPDGSDGVSNPVVDAAGNGYLATDDGELYRYDPTTKRLGRFARIPSGQVLSLRIDPEDSLYVTYVDRIVRVLRNGSTAWTFDAPAGLRMHRGIPAIDMRWDRLFIGAYDRAKQLSTLLAIDRARGTSPERYNFTGIKFSSRMTGTPAIDADGTIYVGTQYTLYAFRQSASGLSLAWSRRFRSVIASAPALRGDGSGTLYFSVWDEVGSKWYVYLVSWDGKRNRERWRVQIPAHSEYDGIRETYLTSNDVVVATLLRERSGPDSFEVLAYRDDGSSAHRLWKRDFGTRTGEKLAFAPSATLYVVGGPELVAVSEGEVGNPRKAGRAFVDNHPPAAPSAPAPADAATEQPVISRLSWTCTDPERQPLTYDVYIAGFVPNEEPYFRLVGSRLRIATLTVSDLLPGTRYYWRVVASDGQAFTGGPTWSFVTVNPAPEVRAVTPGPGATDTAVNTKLTCTWSEPVRTKLLSDAFEVLPATNGRIGYDARTRTATWIPAAALRPATEYTVTIRKQHVQDELGKHMTADYRWRFTTSAVPDTKAPEVRSVSPRDGQVDVPWDVVLSVEFSEQVAAAELPSHLELRQGPNIVPCRVEVTDNVATMTPQYALLPGRKHTLEIRSGVEDLAGNELGEALLVSFTTRGERTGELGGSSSTKCFIATAAYGSPFERHVVVLRSFRDRWLLTNAPGRVLVDAYYRVSPPVADLIREHDWLRLGVRIPLYVIVFGIEHPLAGLLLALAVMVAGAYGIRRLRIFLARLRSARGQA